MPRPPSIVTFERLYGASILLGLVNTALGWKTRQAVLAANPAIAANPQAAAMLGWMVPLLVVVGLAISLLLWFFVARRGSVVAKWILVVLTGLGALTAIGGLVTLLRGLSPDVMTSVLGLVTTGLAVAAAAMLFRGDALPWFGEVPDVEGTFE